MLRNVLARLGLATAAQVAHARQQTEKAVRQADERLARTRADLESWKQRYEEAAREAAQARQAAADAQVETERTRKELERVRVQADEWKARADALTTRLQELKGRLEETRRVTNVARQHLMATETKLDLIEAAIQVLDARTREEMLPPS